MISLLCNDGGLAAKISGEVPNERRGPTHPSELREAAGLLRKQGRGQVKEIKCQPFVRATVLTSAQRSFSKFVRNIWQSARAI